MGKQGLRVRLRDVRYGTNTGIEWWTISTSTLDVIHTSVQNRVRSSSKSATILKKKKIILPIALVVIRLIEKSVVKNIVKLQLQKKNPFV